MKIDIILATWNRADLLHIPIESVLAQTHKDWELWVMDDASEDNTKMVVDKYVDKRINYVRLDKQDYYTIVRNKGVEMGDGELLAFRDSDGAWHETFLEELSKRHTADDVAITYCGRKEFMEVPLKETKFSDIANIQAKKITPPALYTGDDSFANSIDVGDMMVKRKYFDGFSEKRDLSGYCSDARLIDEIISKHPKARFIAVNKPLHYYFHKHGGETENMTYTKLRLREEGNFDNELERKWEF